MEPTRIDTPLTASAGPLPDLRASDTSHSTALIRDPKIMTPIWISKKLALRENPGGRIPARQAETKATTMGPKNNSPPTTIIGAAAAKLRAPAWYAPMP